jgi:hypothetical protein
VLHLLQFHIEEMAEPRLRGTLSACIPLTFSIGIMLISLIGSNTSWRTSAGLGAGIALIDLVCYSYLHESPVWFVRNNRISDARKVFSWLWGSGHQVEVRHTHTKCRKLYCCAHYTFVGVWASGGGKTHTLTH